MIFRLRLPDLRSSSVAASVARVQWQSLAIHEPPERRPLVHCQQPPSSNLLRPAHKSANHAPAAQLRAPPENFAPPSKCTFLFHRLTVPTLSNSSDHAVFLLPPMPGRSYRHRSLAKGVRHPDLQQLLLSQRPKCC